MEVSCGDGDQRALNGGNWPNQWHLTRRTDFSFPPVLVFHPSPQAHIRLLPSFPILSPPPYRFFSLSCPFPSFFDIFWHHMDSKFGQKRAQKRDRWREERRRSGRQMEGEWKDGRRRKEQSLLFLAAGPSYFILLYNWYSFYITITVAPLTLNLSCISAPSSNAWILLSGFCFVILLLLSYTDRRARIVTV